MRGGLETAVDLDYAVARIKNTNLNCGCSGGSTPRSRMIYLNQILMLCTSNLVSLRRHIEEMLEPCLDPIFLSFD